ncbi:selenocysteine-specific elongation factor SelB [Lachnospiraceae bacterium JC7]|nr:selenocysteine-specific elongation factor SelB [Lachnospiraceae bacterium JC7]
MKHIIIGTAGHIDHGKTTLIRALTGRNTDRLKEEQQRGITIDLGFTWFDMKDGNRCGIIDVPGHEKFINNMVAGVVGMDLVLMVIAADEGIMPQTREHLDILELLGINKTILVLNKCDLVDQEWLEMVEEETRERLKGTIMENAPMVPVSSVTGEGIDKLKDTIAEMVKDEVEQRDINSISRLPIDRVFTLPGIGTVITGTLLSGTITQNDDLMMYPVMKECRIRNIQVHGKDVGKCEAGQRVAVNLANIKKEEIHRGCVIAPVNNMETTRRIDVRLKVLKDSERLIRNRERLHLFTGTSEVLCRAVLLDKEELGPGEEGLAQLLLEDDIVVKRGDRFVVRFYSPLETIGGGVVLESNPQKKKRFNESSLDELKRKESGSLADICELTIRQHADTMITRTELSRLTAHSQEELIPYLEELVDQDIILEYPMKKDVFYWHRDSAFAFRQAVTRTLREFQITHPYRYGINKAEIHNQFLKHVKLNVFDDVIARMVEQDIFKLKNEYLEMADFEIVKDDRFIKIEKFLTDSFEKCGYEMLRFSEIDKHGYPDELVMDVLRVLMDEKICVKAGIDLELYTMKHYMDEARKK